jgi:hypothetical protein
MESHIPREMGNMIILFGMMLSLGIFFGFGIVQNMWGGYDLKPEGAIFSLIILFFSLLTGLNFRNQQKVIQKEVASAPGLSNEDRNLVMTAIKQNNQVNEDASSNEPKVIIVKQEQPIIENKLENKEVYPNQIAPQTPYFAYPADYYEDEYDLDDEDEWDEDEDEWEEED